MKKAASVLTYRAALEIDMKNQNQFISAREVAQRLAMAGQVMNQTESARESLFRLTRAFNRQWGPPGFKVDVAADASGYRSYQIYRWDWDNSREVILRSGTVKGSLSAVQAIARREVAAMDASHPTHG